MEAQLDELRRVTLEIYECLKQGAITPNFQKLVDIYEKELKDNPGEKMKEGNHKVECIQCNDELIPSKEELWCSMDCKEKFFIKYYENSKWTTRLIESSRENLKELIKGTMLITPSPMEKGNFIKWLAKEMEKL
ncbi:hypothetical protein LCGC14_1452360 [marine sediment metagenome]|uniref:Uncharacterized protein n=1 Tax=marine sediment metagenome TaxID=412755 RepID=A0A0F9JHG1_9ZZZZ